MSTPEITFEREVILRKVLKIPDRRFKSGYRERTVLAENRLHIPANMDGGGIFQSHTYKLGNRYSRTDVQAQVQFLLEKMELPL